MAINRDYIKIYIAPVDTNPSALAASDVIEGEIISHELSGGNKDVETQPAFGGFIDKQKPVEQYEFSMEVVPNLASTTSASRWEAIAFGQDGSTGVYTPAQAVADKVIGIQALSGAIANSWVFNNANITEFTLSHSADDNRTANITFKFSPTDSDGIPNLQTGAKAITAMTAWSSLSTE